MIDATPLLHLGLLLVRPGTLIVAAPPFGSTFAPAPVKIGLTVLLALVLVPVVDVPTAASSIGLGAFSMYRTGRYPCSAPCRMIRLALLPRATELCVSPPARAW